MDLQQILAESIRNRILASNYKTEEEFAHGNGIPKSTLSELLSGRKNPRLTTLAKICAGLEITLSELLQDSGIDIWVREKAQKYDPRTAKPRAVKSGKKAPPDRRGPQKASR